MSKLENIVFFLCGCCVIILFIGVLGYITSYWNYPEWYSHIAVIGLIICALIGEFAGWVLACYFAKEISKDIKDKQDYYEKQKIKIPNA